LFKVVVTTTRITMTKDTDTKTNTNAHVHTVATTVKDLGPAIVAALPAAVASRFSRVLAFYVGNGNDADIVDMLCMIAEDDEGWRARESDLLGRWTTANSIGDVYVSVIKALSVPEVERAVVAVKGAEMLARIKEMHGAYHKHVLALAESRASTTVKQIVVGGGAGGGSGGSGKKARNNTGRDGESNVGSDSDQQQDESSVDLEAYDQPRNSSGCNNVGEDEVAELVRDLEKYMAFHERMRMYVRTLKNIAGSEQQPFGTGIIMSGDHTGVRLALKSVVEMMEYDMDLVG
jgi:hypothetical protein